MLQNSKDLKTSACTAAGRPHPLLRKLMTNIPEEVLSRFYGCGAPVPLGIQGLRVLDLGSGSGRDCYLSAALVGEGGFVTGIDMTDEQLQVCCRLLCAQALCDILQRVHLCTGHMSEFSSGRYRAWHCCTTLTSCRPGLQVARKHAEAYCQQTLGHKVSIMRFVKGHIELLDEAGIKDESVDLVISNCVINLSPDKARILREAYRVLSPGGEMYFSDTYCDRRIPEHVKQDEVSFQPLTLLAGCEGPNEHCTLPVVYSPGA